MQSLLSVISTIICLCMFPMFVFAAAPTLEMKVINSQTYPDYTYTQGLFLDKSALYISSGLYGRSTFSKWSNDGTLQETFKLPDAFFAEGAVMAGEEIYLLTWKENTVFVLEKDTLKPVRTLKYLSEGWGIAFDGTRLWRSDGSALLYPHNLGDFTSAGLSLRAYDGDVEIQGINELEWDSITGLLLANIYYSDKVAAIDLSNGQVRFWLNAKPLRDLAIKDGLSLQYEAAHTVLNGLAISVDGKSLWLTGKFWPKRYQVAWPPVGLP